MLDHGVTFKRIVHCDDSFIWHIQGNLSEQVTITIRHCNATQSLIDKMSCLLTHLIKEVYIKIDKIKQQKLSVVIAELRYLFRIGDYLLLCTVKYISCVFM